MLSLMESGGVAFLFALFVTPLWIRFVRERSLGQQIREDGPESHRAKAGTPTMGGVVIVAATFLGYLMGHVGTAIVFTRGGILAMAVIVASGALGLLDDYLGIRNARNLGLKKRGKFAGQLIIAGLFATLAHVDLGWRRVPPQEAQATSHQGHRDQAQVERRVQTIDGEMSKLPVTNDRENSKAERA